MQDYNLNEILQPISEASKVGVDLREDEEGRLLYYQIKDARQLARQLERKVLSGESESDSLNAWQDVYKQALELLSTKTKDLEILAWFIEASLRLGQFSGLAKAFQLSEQMVLTYWEELFPCEDVDDGLETKIAAFTGLNGEDSPGTLISPLKSIKIEQSKASDNFVFWQYQQALELEKISDIQKREQKCRDVGLSLAEIQHSVKSTPPKFYQKLLVDLELCKENFKKLDDAFTEKCGIDAPPSSFIHNILEEISEHIGFLLQDTPFKDQVLISKDNLSEVNSSATTNFNTTQQEVTVSKFKTKSVIQSRTEALEILQNVANYFLTSEPHSPIPFLLQRAIKWGNMSLPELFQELIDEGEARLNVTKLTGIEIE